MPETAAVAPASVPLSDSTLPPKNAPTAAPPVSGSPSETTGLLRPLDGFARRHLGSGPADVAAMLDLVGYPTLDALVEAAVPADIQLGRALHLPAALSESEALDELRGIAAKNRVFRSYIGQGYHGTITPPVIQRNILENPGWYTAYTPYQAEIAQGRLEALLNFQTMICDLTGLAVANASLLDEGTAAAEAMGLAFAARGERGKRARFFVSKNCHPQTLAVVRTRARPLGIEIITGGHEEVALDAQFFGVLVQYPGTDGAVHDFTDFFAKAHAAGALTIVAADPLALCLLRPPGEFGADIAVGSTQRFGVPLGGGGPHAAYFAVKDEFKRLMPGRLVGVSKDAQGRPAFRLSLQTREQHIRRDKATSNICTAQVLLAVMAAMYACYHGPEGLKKIARRVRLLTGALAASLRELGYKISPNDGTFFDTLTVPVGAGRAEEIHRAAAAKRINLRRIDDATIGVSLDETVDLIDLQDLWSVFHDGRATGFDPVQLTADMELDLPAPLARTSPFLTHPVFSQHHTETEMLRYLRRLESRDLSLTTSMIPLGSCTMKLNASAEMLPVSWPEFGRIHPFAPAEQIEGYRILAHGLEKWLSEITGLPGTSLQPNAGSQGEYAGLLAIRGHHEARGQGHRDVCLIPTSAHGTNPASAVMAGYRVVPVKCDAQGNIDLADLRAQADQHADALAALMITYPSTHGVFEGTIREICETVHARGGQVYMDGANMNAQVGLCRPGDMGADVVHLNLHKTFCIPHGGGGPGVGPICVAEHLRAFLPHDPRDIAAGEHAGGAVCAAPLGSASILVISWLYIAMMGPDGLAAATKLAILNANYIAKQLEPHYRVLYRGNDGLVAHECILDLRGFKASAGVEVEDVAKRLMDYGFHAPTVSWPVAGTLMVEPTESESKAELDRFCDALIAIRSEIRAVETGEADRADNPLKHAPHTAAVVTADDWPHRYPRSLAAYPAPWSREHKFWPAVGRIDNVYGDRNLVCSCLPMEAYED
ncbi:MAG: aminomethyl-transferring glycine dehydrogenase [Verrucomicrobia bacterium]|nr:aminomethyl-transferring glycine dehydrogenase [Verrucomicrobiota bacterium]